MTLTLYAGRLATPVGEVVMTVTPAGAVRNLLFAGNHRTEGLDGVLGAEVSWQQQRHCKAGMDSVLPYNPTRSVRQS